MANVLHVFDHSLPVQDGYSSRSHSILRALDKFGVETLALTGPKQEIQAASDETIDGIRYERVILPKGQSASGLKGQLRTVRSIRPVAKALLRKSGASIIHAHSPCLNGLAVLGLGVPVVYEMRSSWEDAAVSVGATHEGSARYRLSRFLETRVASAADEVVVICEGLRSELMSRGIPDAKISTVPNALPEHLLQLGDPAEGERVRRSHGLSDASVIGFFGSFFEWEGIDDLVRAMPQIVERLPNAKLLLAGGGHLDRKLRSLAEELALQERVVFAGRVTADQIPAYYQAADIMVFPRKSDRLTEMVTPLKPLEAMAQRTLVVASDVGGHREQIEHGVNGLLYKAGDAESLVETIGQALGGQLDKDGILDRAMNFVSTKRRWEAVSARYLDIYRATVPGIKFTLNRK